MRSVLGLSVLGLGLACACLGWVGQAKADATPQTLPFTQSWSSAGLITTDDSWSGVPGIVGYRGDGLTSTDAVDPQTVVAEGSPPVVDVNANQTNPSTFATGGVTEFAITDPVVALAGSGTADAPNLVITLDLTGQTGVVVAYNLRDIDGSTDNAIQPVALQYRIGTSGNFTNVPAGFVADASTGPSLATLVTAVSATLPAAVDNQAVVQVRIITANATGNDEWIGVDDLSITASAAVCGDGTVSGAEQCDGGSCCSSACTFESAATICRASVGECDAADRCTGSSASCPADAAQPAGTSCGGAPSGDCDAQDQCSGGLGATATCEARLAGSSTVCRPVAGDCDVAESCTGASPSCPPDSFAGAERTCRSAAGPCDGVEVCLGASASCPGDSLLPIGTLCRASAGPCDVAETCAGFASCPADGGRPDGTSCSDALVCNGAEVCRSGACASGSAPSCDDANACTADACAEPAGCRSSPIAGCCNVDADCADDGNVCTAERCSGPGGRCESLRIADCCAADADCTGGSACVRVSCNLSTNRCGSSPVPGCCSRDADCDDGVACTADNCIAATRACSNRVIPGCCAGAGDCNDGDDCTADMCVIPGAGSTGTCSAPPIAGCCITDADCSEADGDLCTTPSCNVVTERCMETALDCDDGDPCTADACASDGSCASTPIPGCGGSDAGTMADASVPADDAGGLGEDAGASADAGVLVMDDAAMGRADASAAREDAAVDAGRMDGGTVSPDGAIAPPTRAGCSCTVPARDDPTGRSRGALLAALALLGAVLGRRRAQARARR